MTTGQPDRPEPEQGTTVSEEPRRLAVTCPDCSTVTDLFESELSHTFCPTCDYPLFYTKESREISEAAERAAQEAPGAASEEPEEERDAQVTDRICTNCAKRNPGDRVYCMRCGHELPPPEEWYREDEAQVEAEPEPPLWHSAAFIGVSVVSVLIAAFLVLHFTPLDAIWPDQTYETKVVVSGAEGIANTSVVMVGDPQLPAIAYYSAKGSDPKKPNDSLAFVICGNTQCSEDKLGPGDIPGKAFDVDPEGTPGKDGLAIVRISGSALAVYQRAETGALVAVECGTLGCDDSLGTRRFFPVDEGARSLLDAVAFLDSGIANTSEDLASFRDPTDDDADDLKAIAEDLRGLLVEFNDDWSSLLARVEIEGDAEDQSKDFAAAIVEAIRVATTAVSDPSKDNIDAAIQSADAAIGILERQPLEEIVEDFVLDVGFDAIARVSGGVTVALYADRADDLHLAFLCDQACLDDDGVVNLRLGGARAPDGSMALAFPRAGAPYIAYVGKPEANKPGNLRLDQCENVTCSETSAGSARGVEIDEISVADQDGNAITVSTGERQLGMIIDPDRLSPEIAYLTDSGLWAFSCLSQPCTEPVEPVQIDSDAINSEIAMARGSNGLAVIAYRKKTDVDGDEADTLWVAVCRGPCDTPESWTLEMVDDGEPDGTNQGRVWAHNWPGWPFRTTGSDDVGYNLSITVANDIAVVTHTDVTASKLRVTRIDLERLVPGE